MRPDRLLGREIGRLKTSAAAPPRRLRGPANRLHPQPKAASLAIGACAGLHEDQEIDSADRQGGPCYTSVECCRHPLCGTVEGGKWTTDVSAGVRRGSLGSS